MTNWRDQAACKGQTALFFTLQMAPNKRVEDYNRAKEQFCDRCPVRDICLDEALTTKLVTHSGTRLKGIWAGTTEIQRRKLREQRQNA